VSEQLIEEARLAGVGAAEDGGAEAAAEDSAFAGGGEQFVHERDAGVEARGEFLAGVGAMSSSGKSRWASTWASASRRRSRR